MKSLKVLNIFCSQFSQTNANADLWCYPALISHTITSIYSSKLLIIVSVYSITAEQKDSASV